MKKLLLLTLPLLLAACSSSSIDITDRSNYGMKCSSNAATAPNWDACVKRAQAICGGQKVGNMAQHEPTGSGDPSDSYFLSFQCQ